MHETSSIGSSPSGQQFAIIGCSRILQSTVSSEIYAMETATLDEAVQERERSDTAAVPCPPSVAIAPTAAIVDPKSASSLIDRLESSLHNACTSEEVKELRDLSTAMRQYLRNIGASLQEQNRAAEIKIRAERRLGEALARLEKAKGGGDQRCDHRSHDATGGPLTLADIGITRTQSSRWQAMASVPPDDFEKHLAKVKDHGDELTSASVIRLAKRLAQAVRNSATAKPADDGDPATGGEEVNAIAEIGNSIAGTAAEDQSRANAITEPRDAAGADKAKEVSQTPDPKERDSSGQGTAQADRPQQGALTVGIQIFPDIDPYSERQPPWVRGALHSIALIACSLPHLPNKDRITTLALQVIDALAPALLETPIPKEERRLIVGLLRAHCGYRTFVDQLLDYWANADEAITRQQLEDVPDRSSSGSKPVSALAPTG
jgi:hypothetical protein